jgi:hypothetical protein
MKQRGWDILSDQTAFDKVMFMGAKTLALN